MERHVIKNYYNYKITLLPYHNGIIIFDNVEKNIRNSMSFEFTSENPLTYKEVVEKVKGTLGIVSIEGIFKFDYAI